MSVASLEIALQGRSHRSCAARTEEAIPGPNLCFLFDREFQEFPPTEAGYQQRRAGGWANSEQGW